MKPWSLFIALAVAGLLGACEAAPWVVASESSPESDAPLPRTSGSFAGGVEPCESLAGLAERRATWGAPLASSASHAGLWRGSISGSAALAFPAFEVGLELLPDGSGSLWFESASAPPEPENAEAGYLCNGSVSGGVCGSVSGFVGGFAYPLETVAARGNILSFSIVDADPWQDWCSQQQPIARADPFVGCGTAFDALPPGDEHWSPEGCQVTFDTGSEPIDCDRMYSLERCQCAPDGCVASFASWIEVGLRSSPDRAELSGSLWFKDETDAALLRLRRQ